MSIAFFQSHWISCACFAVNLICIITSYFEIIMWWAIYVVAVSLLYAFMSLDSDNETTLGLHTVSMSLPHDNEISLKNEVTSAKYTVSMSTDVMMDFWCVPVIVNIIYSLLHIMNFSFGILPGDNKLTIVIYREHGTPSHETILWWGKYIAMSLYLLAMHVMKRYCSGSVIVIIHELQSLLLLCWWWVCFVTSWNVRCSKLADIRLLPCHGCNLGLWQFPQSTAWSPIPILDLLTLLVIKSRFATCSLQHVRFESI